ncbi:unnamed protein product, partial [Cyprideis torosa]
FQQPFKTAENVIVGIGDDAAVTQIPADQQLVTTVDTLVAGVHFPPDTAAADIGYKSLAVSLSDLAAMGASPQWFTLALTLPQNNPAWLAQFSQGLQEIAQLGEITLIGGDTTRGQLTITIQAMGFVPLGQALLRSTAQVDDDIYVSGTVGDAAMGLAMLQQKLPQDLNEGAFFRARLNRPTPRNAAGIAL